VSYSTSWGGGSIARSISHIHTLTLSERFITPRTSGLWLKSWFGGLHLDCNTFTEEQILVRDIALSIVSLSEIETE